MEPNDSWKRNTFLVIFNLCIFAWKDQNRQKMADTEESDDGLKPHTREVCEQGDTVKVIKTMEQFIHRVNIWGS